MLRASTMLPPRNATYATTTVLITTGITMPLDVSNATQSSALDDAHFQRTLLKPKFLTDNSSTVVAQTGASSRISCLVANLGDCVVSRPVLIFTSGVSFYISNYIHHTFISKIIFIIVLTTILLYLSI